MKHQEKIIIFLLTAVYLLCSIRYFPDLPQKTTISTASHLLTVAPFIIGAIIIINSLVRKAAGEALAGSMIARLYLSIGIVIEFFIGIYNYLKINS